MIARPQTGRKDQSGAQLSGSLYQACKTATLARPRVHMAVRRNGLGGIRMTKRVLTGQGGIWKRGRGFPSTERASARKMEGTVEGHIIFSLILFVFD